MSIESENKAASEAEEGQVSTEAASPDAKETRSTSRRALLKKLGLSVGVLSAWRGSQGTGLARLLPKEKVPVPTLTGNNMLIGNSNSPTTPSDVTRLYNPSSSTLMDKGFNVSNYTNSLITSGPDFSNTRMALVASTSGSDTSANSRFGVVGAIDGENDSVSSGVWGVAFQNGVGVRGRSASGAGVKGVNVANGYGGDFGGGLAAVLLVSDGSSNSPLVPARAHNSGELFKAAVDNSLWYCDASGTPGDWRKLAGQDTAGSFHLLGTPDRFVDTRGGGVGPVGTVTGYGPAAAPTGAQIVNVPMWGRTGQQGRTIPQFARAIVGRIFATDQKCLVSAWPGGAAFPGDIYSGGFGEKFPHGGDFLVCSLNAAGQLSIAAQRTCDVIIDVVGYYM